MPILFLNTGESPVTTSSAGLNSESASELADLSQGTTPTSNYSSRVGIQRFNGETPTSTTLVPPWQQVLGLVTEIKVTSCFLYVSLYC